MRSGDEPRHARSPLRLRLTLALGGGAFAGVGVVLSALAGHALLAWLCSGIAMIALVNAAVVVAHLRQGARYQPGPGVPPYAPVPDRPPHPPPAAAGVAEPVRMRRYLWLMGTCLTLITLAWTLVRLYSTTAAVVMSLVAMVIPPIAAVVANAGWSRDR